jgi:hypothetical protein
VSGDVFMTVPPLSVDSMRTAWPATAPTTIPGVRGYFVQDLRHWRRELVG